MSRLGAVLVSHCQIHNRDDKCERGGKREEAVPLLELDGGHWDWPRLGDSPRLDAGDNGHPVFDRHLVQDRAARVVVQSPLLSPVAVTVVETRQIKPN